MSRPFPNDPFLQGNYASFPLEGEIHDCVVEGEVPRELDGTLYRNGPNPQYAPPGRYHWFDGDGMIHAFAIHNGRVAYRNRWVRTARFSLERAAGEGLFGGLADMAKTDPRAATTSPNAANTNIVFHAGRLLALWEGGPPHALDPRTLETIGPFDFRGKLVGPMTAHPKIDPESGEMLFFGYSFTPPFLRYHVVAKDGTLVRSEEIEVAVPTMMHDFITTREHVIFLVCPATIRLENVEKTGSPLGWEPELGTRIGVMPRSGGSRDIVWFEANPCYVFHPMNAYSERGRIVADVCRYPRLPLFDAGDRAEGMEDLTAKLTRWTLDLAGGTVKEEALDDISSEFPRLDERRSGLSYRHGYAGGLAPTSAKASGFNAIVHYDLEAGRRRMHVVPEKDAVGEPIFVPRTPTSPEGEGFLLATVYRGAEMRSDLVILDAENVDSAPLATVRLPHRVPFGFHGNWGQGI
ncbi:MAG TPA: carotenoid oxygenase family protein [Myxococcota bacterium]|nr:carotenoid oxygenase family protein [Myxococcota bacterium]